MILGGQGVATQVLPADYSIDHSNDVHYQATLLRAWEQQYTQLNHGHFSGSVSTVRSGGITLFNERMNRATLQVGAVPVDNLAFGLPLHGSGQSCICGEGGDEHSLLVFSGRSGFEFHSPQDFEFIGVEIDTVNSNDSVFLALAETLSRIISSGKRSFALKPEQAAKLGRVLQETLAEDWICLRDNPNFEAAFNRGLLGWLLDMLEVADGKPGNVPMRHWDAVTRIRHLVSNDIDCPLSVAELTMRLGLSRRTLQSACREIVGLSPVEYLRALRLSEARRMLERSQSVTEAATQFGFWHLGYFARDYHAMFGELPSKTLERHRRRAA